MQPKAFKYTIFSVVNNSETKEENNIDFNLALISGISSASVVVMFVLLLVCLKKYSKLCFGKLLKIGI